MFVSNKVIAESGIQFGTSGARGLVEQFTPSVCAAFAHAFLNGIQDSFSFRKVAVAIDNRPSSPAMAQATISAIESMGLEPIYYGVVPTPALAYSAMQEDIPCIMITGSHIPFDRNGIKFYRPDGEITKADEQSIINAEVGFEEPTFKPLTVSNKAAEQYVARYTDLFKSDLLLGKRIGIYEHSSAGRDLYQGLFEALGADVISLERTDEFVPIDTEAVAEVDKVKAKNWSSQYNLDFIFSTDGDGDRPLVADENGVWLRGDILGLLCAEAMNVEALAIPVSCNTIIEQSKSFKSVSKTKIGSPYVVAEFAELNSHYSSVAGFEANGGFLLGSDIEINAQTLKALPTRDAVLPAIMLLSASKCSSIVSLVDALPKRFTHSDRIQNFATAKSVGILEDGKLNPQQLINKLNLDGLSVVDVNTVDGLRLTLSDNTIVHLRPSGNAPELRCYTEASDTKHASDLVTKVLAAVQKL
ncbi:phosphomannomutase [Vibrio ezurae]|uniref:Phosphoglucosamine mutase n=1 Tax=Vibrio ezurae NBRC 102218 TaxID=1219080 RepID=U3CEF1_9VIBR|nr:phosphomannomutase [Vibrio ezurae]GAD79644.1 phosphoglucosamine mutase [Vibrio ezurae NBRC 102218]